MAIFDAIDAQITTVTKVKTAHFLMVEFSNMADILAARAGQLVERFDGKTATQLIAEGVPSLVAPDLVKVVNAASQIRTKILDQVTAERIRNGQYPLPPPYLATYLP